MNEIQEILGAVGGQVGGVATGDAVVGSPVKVGELTVYAISRITLGLGAAGGSGDELGKQVQGQHGTGGGAGGGAKARPVAVLVFSEQGVSVLPIPDKAGKIDQLLEKVPNLIDRLKEPAKS